MFCHSSPSEVLPLMHQSRDPILRGSGQEEDEDILKCGKCKQQFHALEVFIAHKKGCCKVNESTPSSSLSNNLNMNMSDHGQSLDTILSMSHSESDAMFTSLPQEHKHNLQEEIMSPSLSVSSHHLQLPHHNNVQQHQQSQDDTSITTLSAAQIPIPDSSTMSLPPTISISDPDLRTDEWTRLLNERQMSPVKAETIDDDVVCLDEDQPKQRQMSQVILQAVPMDTTTPTMDDDTRQNNFVPEQTLVFQGYDSKGSAVFVLGSGILPASLMQMDTTDHQDQGSQMIRLSSQCINFELESAPPPPLPTQQRQKQRQQQKPKQQQLQEQQQQEQHQPPPSSQPLQGPQVQTTASNDMHPSLPKQQMPALSSRSRAKRSSKKENLIHNHNHNHHGTDQSITSNGHNTAAPITNSNSLLSSPGQPQDQVTIMSNKMEMRPFEIQFVEIDSKSGSSRPPIPKSKGHLTKDSLPSSLSLSLSLSLSPCPSPSPTGKKRKKLRCSFCERAFNKNFDLQQHIRCHTGEKPFQCVVCGRAFAQKSNVKKHMQTHKVWPDGEQEIPSSKGMDVSPSGQENYDQEAKCYRCHYCTHATKTFLELKAHMKHHKKEKVFKCTSPSCGKSFEDMEPFIEHLASHENDLAYNCLECGEDFTSLIDLGNHQLTHSGPPIPIQAQTKAHIKYFRCHMCLNKYTTPSALEHHLATSTHQHQCGQCSKIFPCERYLRRHMITHGSGLHVCKYCEKVFKTANYLKVHMVIHTGEKPYECNMCDASFNRRDKLKRHKLSHDPMKKLQCPFRNSTGCNKEFCRPDKLKAHLITHSGLKPYECPKCMRTFSRRAHLRAHFNNHMGEETAKCSKGLSAHQISTLEEIQQQMGDNAQPVPCCEPSSGPIITVTDPNNSLNVDLLNNSSLTDSLFSSVGFSKNVAYECSACKELVVVSALLGGGHSCRKNHDTDKGHLSPNMKRKQAGMGQPFSRLSSSPNKFLLKALESVDTDALMHMPNPHTTLNSTAANENSQFGVSMSSSSVNHHVSLMNENSLGVSNMEHLLSNVPDLMTEPFLLDSLLHGDSMSKDSAKLTSNEHVMLSV